ncbi:MAG: glycosyltransferase family 2 protein [Candidatus Latescibacteria bacterium]|nr:glycosyltransferase family 2 protein [Candidatus Latescibacterota bacterium]
MASVTVIIVLYNGRRWIDACLSSVLATDYPNFRALVVDNASTDGGAAYLRERFPDVEMIASPVNVGFAEGNNIGIRRALAQGRRYLVLLNQDTVVTPSWLIELVRAAEANPDAGILNPLLRNYEDTDLDRVFRELADRNEAFRRDLTAGSPGPFYDLPKANGAAMFVRREVFERVGLFDPLYFAYFEETDLCRRAALAGYRIGAAPRSVVRHWRATAHPELMSWRIRHLSVRNEFLFTLKNPGQGLMRNVLDYARLSLTRRYAGLTRRRLAAHMALTHLWVARHFFCIVRRRREERRMIEAARSGVRRDPQMGADERR